MDNVVFVILHYITSHETLKCVDSIRNRILYDNYSIVIVDNGSGDGSGELLKKKFSDDSKIVVLINEKNEGFSAGNNIGYKYAKEKLDADYIVVMNNDTEIVQENFIELIVETYKKDLFYVLGPDIVNLDGIHQSPQRNHFITYGELNKWYYKRFVFTNILKIFRFLGIKETGFWIKKYIEHDSRRKGEFNFSCVQEDVELQGACYIFSPLFVRERAYAFEEISFMYGEETMLAYQCKEYGWKMMYYPSLKIIHHEKATSRTVTENFIEHEIFYSSNLTRALKAIRKFAKNKYI